MAYNGYLLKFDTTQLSSIYIMRGTYKATPSQMLDLDPYRDADGYLHRGVLSHAPAKIEWETPYLTNTQMQALLAIIKGAMSDTVERKTTVEYYDDYNNKYQSGTFYVPDIDFVPYSVTAAGILYTPTRIALIEY